MENKLDAPQILNLELTHNSKLSLCVSVPEKMTSLCQRDS